MVGFVVLGSVFLAVTGAEALYADMGHFGRGPIRAAWIGLVFPALALNYLGRCFGPQAARRARQPVLPDGAGLGALPLVLLATVAM